MPFRCLMQDVTVAAVVGKTVIGGVKCDHLLFSRPDVDFQVWIAEGSRPFPHKYVVTETTTPALLSITTVLSNWKTDAAVDDAQFKFVPPKGTSAIRFLPRASSWRRPTPEARQEESHELRIQDCRSTDRSRRDVHCGHHRVCP